MAVTLSTEEEQVIKHRLLTQTTVARLNADPPLKKVAKRCASLGSRCDGTRLPASHVASASTRFVALATAADQGVDRAGAAKLHAQLLRELALFEFQARRVGDGVTKALGEKLSSPPSFARAVVKSSHRMRR